MADRSLIIVNYFSAGLSRVAIDSARRSSRIPLEIVVVDNSCDESELAALQGAGADRVVAAPSNLGYAGGANLGVRNASGDVVVLANPDVVFREACIDRLVDALVGPVAMAGPRFTWDDAGEWLMPPADLLTGAWKFEQLLGKSSGWVARRRASKRFADRVRFWSLQSVTEVSALSGAVLAIDRAALRAVGGFDEQYALYFEEIDLARAFARIGRRLAYVPAAHCHHLYNQSAGGNPEHELKFAASEARYVRKWESHWSILLGLVPDARVAPAHPARERVLLPGEPIPIPGGVEPGSIVIEASPLADFDTASGHLPVRREIFFPEDVWRAYRSATLFVRVVETSSGRVLERCSMAR